MRFAKYNDDTQSVISHEDLGKLVQKVANSLMLDEEIATSLVYNELDTIERLFAQHKKLKAVQKHLLLEIEGEYRGFICSDC